MQSRIMGDNIAKLVYSVSIFFLSANQIKDVRNRNCLLLSILYRK